MQKVLSSQYPILRKKIILERVPHASKRGMGIFARLRQLRTENWGVRTLTLLLASIALAGPALSRAQQVDFAVGGSTLWSPKPLSASQAYVPPALKGGTYAQASLQYLTERRLGLNIEGAFRVKQGLYNGSQYYRPILYDVNAVYAHRLATKMRGDFMAGVGGETLLFYNQIGCGYTAGCRIYVNSNHFLLHGGFGVRYYFWRRYFVRPEAHYYLIPNNVEFHSDHVFRIGVSIGHTFGAR